MCDEKVTVVKCMIMKLVKKVPTGYSKSTDKIGEQLKERASRRSTSSAAKTTQTFDGAGT